MFAIVIPVYNNAKTINETLDSLLILKDLRQVELVVSDDCSTDTTVDLVRHWIAQHGASFGRTALVCAERNGGISANHKLAFGQVESPYGLYIGGDDLVSSPDLVEQIGRCLAKHPAAIAKVAVRALYRPSGQVQDMYGRLNRFFAYGAKKQYRMLATYGNFLYAGPGTVLDINLLKSINAFDERFRTFEDYPLFLNFLAAGHAIRFLPVEGIFWVRSEHSLSAGGFKHLKGRFDEELDLMRSDFILGGPVRLTMIDRLVLSSKSRPFLYRCFQKASRIMRGFPA